jgi:hypothetical protein
LPPLSVADDELGTVTAGTQRCVVAVVDGYEAATYDQGGHIDFWRYQLGAWTVLARRQYPSQAAPGSPTTAGETDAVSVSGQVLDGMAEPVYIVSGHFGEGGSANDVAFADGPVGWGVVAEQADGALSPTGRSLTAAGPGLVYGERFVAGHFEILDRPSLWDAALDAAFPVITQWSWAGSSFLLDDSNIVTAQVAPTPPVDAPALPATAVIADGTYTAKVAGVGLLGASVDPLVSVELQPGALVGRCQDGAGCFVPEGKVRAVVVGATTATSYAARRGSAITWVSGPAWALAVPYGLCCDATGPQGAAPGLSELGASSWYVPPGLGVSAFVAPHDPVVTVTVRDGVVDALGELSLSAP